MSLHVDILDSARSSLGCHHLGCSFLVSSSAPTTPPPSPCAGTVIAKSLVHILQRLTTWCPLRREVPDYMRSKFAMTKTTVNPTVLEPAFPPPPEMPGSAHSSAFWDSGVTWLFLNICGIWASFVRIVGPPPCCQMVCPSRPSSCLHFLFQGQRCPPGFTEDGEGVACSPYCLEWV